MTPIFRNDSVVSLEEHVGTDRGVVRAARVSVKGLEDTEGQRLITAGDISGLIRHMMKNRHGSVFEHNMFTFRVHTPIFVAREFMRHRTFSFNEESARYKELEPIFWIPAPGRKLRQEGKPSEYKMVEGDQSDYLYASADIMDSSDYAYARYRRMLDRGIAREVARAVLPVNTYTSFYATCNARALMSFLSLRIDHPDNTVETHPQAEIQSVAEQMELAWFGLMPVTYSAWASSGRVAP